MESELGRNFQDRLLDQQKLLRALYDLAYGCGADVSCWVQGRELVFGRGEKESGRGFVRLIPLDVMVMCAFPRGDRLFDPTNRLQGPQVGQRSLTLMHHHEIDPHVRRILHAAYAAED